MASTAQILYAGAAAVSTVAGLLIIRQLWGGTSSPDTGGNGGGELVSESWDPSSGEVQQAEAESQAGAATQSWVNSRADAGEDYIMVGPSRALPWKGKPPGQRLDIWEQLVLPMLSNGNAEGKIWWIEVDMRDPAPPPGNPEEFFIMVAVDGINANAQLVSFNPLDLYFPQ